MDIAVCLKNVFYFANNKPWITGDVKQLLNNKKRVFKDGDQTEVKGALGNFVGLKEAKHLQRRKVNA